MADTTLSFDYFKDITEYFKKWCMFRVAEWHSKFCYLKYLCEIKLSRKMGIDFLIRILPTLFGCALRFSARSIDFTLGGKFTRWFLQQHYKGANRVHSALQIWLSFYKCKFWDQKFVAIDAFALSEVATCWSLLLDDKFLFV